MGAKDTIDSTLNVLPDLQNHEGIFSYRSTAELKKFYWLYLLIQNKILAKIISLTAIGLHRLKFPLDFIYRNTVFKLFCGGETLSECTETVQILWEKKIGSILDFSAEGKNDEAQFNQVATEIEAIIKYSSRREALPFTCIKLSGIGRADLFRRCSSGQDLSQEEKKEFEHFKKRFESLCSISSSLKLPFNIDAEESWVQPVLDELTVEMMRKYNKEAPLISITLQMYRTDRLAFLHKLILDSETEGFYPAVKLVRGAYWEKERKRAEKNHEPSPVYATKKETDDAFDLATSICCDHIQRLQLSLATHNDQSTMKCLQLMKENGIQNDHPNINFSQLYGMSDNITGNLAKHGYKVAKFIPYGPVGNVMPYLIRRIDENKAVKGQMGREFLMIKNELKRRQ